MNRFRQFAIYVAASCLLLTMTCESRADSYALDGSHTSIVFGISHFGYSYTYGRFNRTQGSFAWDNANPAASRFVVAIEAASLDSNDQKRDDHLRGADFFNVNQFPQIIFQSTSVRPAQQNNPQGNVYDVVGNLTIHGVTKQVTLPMKKLGEGLGPYGKYRCGFYCQTTINRSEFGMTNMIPKIGDQVAITISFEGTREGAAGSGSATSGNASSTDSSSQPKPFNSDAVPAGAGSALKAGSSSSR